MHAKPVAVLDPDGFYAPLWDWIQLLSARGFVRPEAWQLLIRVSAVPAAFDALERALA
jgi:predicted Rossmann-fold nucleotide-binding protein